MKTVAIVLSCVMVCLLTGVPLNTHAQFALPPSTVPDLVVSNIACKAPGSNLMFTITNAGTALPAGWTAVAYVYIGTTKVASVNLKSPSSGSIATSRGSASYVTNIIITKSSSVKVVVDPLNTVKEYYESNNSKTVTLNPCTSSSSAPNVSLDYQLK